MNTRSINWDLAREANDTLVGLYHAYWCNVYKPEVSPEFILEYSKALQLVLQGRIHDELEFDYYLTKKGLLLQSP